MESGDSEKLTTEQRILIAAREEFAQKGFYGAKTISIAQAAGVTMLCFIIIIGQNNGYMTESQKII